MLDAYRAHGQAFFLVVVPEDDNPKLLTYNSVSELVTAIQGYLGQPVSLFPFLGHAMAITKAPRYLKTPAGMLPLFAIPKPDELEYETGGYVGTDSNELAIAQSLSPPAVDEGDDPPAPADDPAMASHDDGSDVLPEAP